MPHVNSPLTLQGRHRLVGCIVEEGGPYRRAAERRGARRVRCAVTARPVLSAGCSAGGSRGRATPRRPSRLRTATVWPCRSRRSGYRRLHGRCEGCPIGRNRAHLARSQWYPPVGLEPTTFGLKVRSSNQLS